MARTVCELRDTASAEVLSRAAVAAGMFAKSTVTEEGVRVVIAHHEDQQARVDQLIRTILEHWQPNDPHRE